jgi:hypothetical protein
LEYQRSTCSGISKEGYASISTVFSVIPTCSVVLLCYIQYQGDSESIEKKRKQKQGKNINHLKINYLNDEIMKLYTKGLFFFPMLHQCGIHSAFILGVKIVETQNIIPSG